MDKSGNDHHAKLIDQASRVNGKFGYALSFDGDNDGLAFSKVEFMDSPDSFSIAFWFNRHTDINGTENQTNHGVNNLLTPVIKRLRQRQLWKLEVKGQNLKFIWIPVAELKMLLTQPRGASLEDGNWYHLVMTYSEDLRLYLDGNLLFQQPYGGPLDSSQDSPLSLGMARIFRSVGRFQWFY